MLLCQRKRGATWTSEKDENVQRLLERSTKLSDGCAFRECERMSDGKTLWPNVFAMESRILQSLYKRMEEGNADLNLTLKILQQRADSLEQHTSRSNVAFVHLRGGLSRQAAASKILFQGFQSIRDALDELKTCSEANKIESKQWTAQIEGKIASLNHKVQKHETEGIKARKEEGRVCNDSRMQPDRAEDKQELLTRFQNDLENTAMDSWREMEGRLSQKMSRDIETTVLKYTSSSPVENHHRNGRTEESMKDSIINAVRKELETMVQNELNAIEGRIMSHTMKSINSLVHDTVSNELSAALKDLGIEKHVRKEGFYITSGEEDGLDILHDKDSESMISSQQALSLRSQKMEADTDCFAAESPELNQSLTELTKRVDALTNELRARRRSDEYCEEYHQKKEGGGEGTTEVVKNRVPRKEHEHNATDLQEIISTQDTLLLRLEQMESIFISISQKYSLPVVENLAVEVPALNKRLTDLTKRIDAITVSNGKLIDDDTLPRRRDASDIEMRMEEQYNSNFQNLISMQDDLLLRLVQVESIILLNGQKDSPPTVDFVAAVQELSARSTEATKQANTLTSKLKEERSPGNQEKEEKVFSRHSDECAGIAFEPSPPLEQENEIEWQISRHPVETAPIPPKAKEDRGQSIIGSAVSIPPDKKSLIVTGEENEMGASKVACQADVEVANNCGLSIHHPADVGDVETTPRVVQVLGVSTRCNKEHKRVLDRMVINHKQDSLTAINDEVGKVSALDRLRAWRADIAALRKEGKQQLDSDGLEESPCSLLNY